MQTAVCLYRKFLRLVEMNLNSLSCYRRDDSKAGRTNCQLLKGCMNRNFQIIGFVIYYNNIIKGVCMIYHALRSIADNAVFC